MTQAITDEEFQRFRHLIHDAAGIAMADEKKVLVATRLAKRLRHHNLDSYGAYYRLVTAPEQTGEFQLVVDLLTTNETYFNREPQHFSVLADLLRERSTRNQVYRIWSAACSSGEEAYTLAMTLAENLQGQRWEIVGTDISSRMILSCEQGVYPMSRAEKLPLPLLHKHCLRGVRSQEGMIRVSRALRERCSFRMGNILESARELGQFDIIFMRNVMIYFDSDTKKRVVGNVLKNLKPGGYLFISHSETLHGITGEVDAVAPAVYRSRSR